MQQIFEIGKVLTKTLIHEEILEGLPNGHKTTSMGEACEALNFFGKMMLEIKHMFDV